MSGAASQRAREIPECTFNEASSDEAIEFIRNMLVDLDKFAKAHEKKFLSYLLTMAILETEILLETPDRSSK